MFSGSRAHEPKTLHPKPCTGLSVQGVGLGPNVGGLGSMFHTQSRRSIHSWHDPEPPRRCSAPEEFRVFRV